MALYVLRTTDLLILFGIRKIFQSSGCNLLLYLFIRMAIKLSSIIEECHLHTKEFQSCSLRNTLFDVISLKVFRCSLGFGESEEHFMGFSMCACLSRFSSAP
jgi:hypothetical protein